MAVAPYQVERRPLIYGRNFVETLVLTLLYYELQQPDLPVREYIVMRLEEELCSLAMMNPQLEVYYREAVAGILDEMYPELPKPEFRGCFAYERVKAWLRGHEEKILEIERDLIEFRDVERRVREVAVRIIRTAILGVLHKVGVLSVAHA